MQALHMQLALDNFARIQNQTLLLPFGQLAPLEIKSRFRVVFRLHSSSAGFLGVALSPRALVMGQYFFYGNPPILNWHERRSSPGFSTFRTALDPFGTMQG